MAAPIMHPGRQIGERMRRKNERNEPGRAGERADRHDDVAAMAVDHPSDGRRDQSGRQEPDR